MYFVIPRGVYKRSVWRSGTEGFALRPSTPYFIVSLSVYRSQWFWKTKTTKFILRLNEGGGREKGTVTGLSLGEVERSEMKIVEILWSVIHFVTTLYIHEEGERNVHTSALEKDDIISPSPTISGLKRRRSLRGIDTIKNPLKRRRRCQDTSVILRSDSKCDGTRRWCRHWSSKRKLPGYFPH